LLLLPACCHLLSSPATSAAAARLAKTRPEVAQVLEVILGRILSNQSLRFSLVALWSTNQPSLHEAKIPIGVATNGSGVTPTLAVRSGRSVPDSYQLPTPVEPLTPLLRDTPSPGEWDSKVICHVTRQILDRTNTFKHYASPNTFTHTDNPHDGKILPPISLNALNHSVPIRVTATRCKTSSVLLTMWVVLLNLVGGPSLSVMVLTSNLCGLFGQSALFAAAGAKKGLFVHLKKPERIHHMYVSAYSLPCSRVPAFASATLLGPVPK